MYAITSLLFVAAILLLCLYTLHKVRLTHILLHAAKDDARQDVTSLFRQLEALQGLYVDLHLQRSLPVTRGWAASPDFLRELARHALQEKPRNVVECSSGTSTLVLARCMQLNGYGKVYSLEHDPHFARQTRRQLAYHGLSAWAEVLDAPLRPHQFHGESWPWYSEEVLPDDLEIAMLVIDGPPHATRPLARYPAGPALFHRLLPGASVYLDDADRADELAMLRRWRQEFPAMLESQRECEKGCIVLAWA